MHLRVIVTAVCLFMTLVEGSPLGDGLSTLSEVFKLCSDLENDGYEGYKCISKSTCQDGYIVDDAINEPLTVKEGSGIVKNNDLDVSNYECPEKDGIVSERQDGDYYYDENYEYDSSEKEKICCRDPKFYGKGGRKEKIISHLFKLCTIPSVNC